MDSKIAELVKDLASRNARRGARLEPQLGIEKTTFESGVVISMRCFTDRGQSLVRIWTSCVYNAHLEL